MATTRMVKLRSGSLMIIAAVLFPVVSSLNDEGKALMSIKASFSKVLLDWDETHNEDFCSWRGVVCDDKSASIVSLNLSTLYLGGAIPRSLADLKNLIHVDLSGNKLTGPIPPEIGNMSKLCYLHLNDNQLVGEIPPQLGKLEQLFELNLANNQLEGHVPQNISSCRALNQLNVCGNRLSGSIPLGFMNLESLTYLNLSRNHFDGPLPAEFGHLRSIQTIDVSFNNFSGHIPDQLGQLQTLESLNVSNNNLSGIVSPTGNFSRFSPDSFIGNPLLCGNWLGSICDTPRIVNSKAGFSKTSVFLTVIILVAAVVLLVLCMVMVPRWYKSNPYERIMQDSRVGLHTDMAIRIYEDIVGRLDEVLNEQHRIGSGASSKVYKCLLKNNRPIAIKQLDIYKAKEFAAELRTISGINDRNLVSFHGYAFSPKGNLLFFDYMENGSLYDLLHGGPPTKKKLDWVTRLKIAVGAANGLAYLHHRCIPIIIHRDVKSANIFVDENFEARLGDFGMAESIPTWETHGWGDVVGTCYYVDPHYTETSLFNEKSDVYSFGIVLLEVITGMKAQDIDLKLDELIAAKQNDKMEAITDLDMTCLNLDQFKSTFDLALCCMKRNPSERPTMQDVAQILLTSFRVVSGQWWFHWCCLG